MTKLLPVVAIVANEVCDLLEGLVHDNMLEWNDDDD